MVNKKLAKKNEVKLLRLVDQVAYLEDIKIFPHVVAAIIPPGNGNGNGNGDDEPFKIPEWAKIAVPALAAVVVVGAVLVRNK